MRPSGARVRRPWLLCAGARRDVGRLSGQEQGRGAPPATPGGGVQVGVPQGRGRRSRAAADVRPVRRPVRRRAQPTAGSCSAARRPSQKGVWLPGGGGVQTTAGDAVVPFQPWAKALLADRGMNQLEPHTRCKPSGFVAPVPDALRRRVRRSARDPARLHLRHRRAAHVPHHLHGRPHASGESPAGLLRPLHRLVGRRHAGRGHRRLQRRLLDGSARLAAHREAAHARALHPHRRGDDQVRSDGRRSGRVHVARGRAGSTCAGKTARSCSNTCASRPTTRRSSWSAGKNRSTARATSFLKVQGSGFRVQGSVHRLEP